MIEWSVIVACNSDDVLETCLRRSPELGASRELLVQRDFASAGAAYNAGIQAAHSETLIFAHQDVYLPPGWLDSFNAALAWLSARDENWGALGVFGLSAPHEEKGFVYSAGLQHCVGRRLHGPAEVVTLDELLLVTRKSSGLRFDAALPGFHLYGTDICLEARRLGMKSYVIPAFCIHNSNGIDWLPGAYWQAYDYLRRKWSKQLPVHTPCGSITGRRLPKWRYMLTRTVERFIRPGKVGRRHPDPVALYQRLCDEHLL